MNKLKVVVKFQAITPRKSFTNKEKYLFKFSNSEEIIENLELFNIHAFLLDNGDLQVHVISQTNKQEILKSFVLQNNQEFVYVPPVSDVRIQYAFLFKTKE